ncbi:MAG TPA: type I glutamate--ammonia ligase [Candidatus Krumholzibacteria bacterium]|nr:type I glutamate--ammonia ligase [Candidatus Krumholzibacteria bacterium]HPD72633.1 type I glutamate--ammonia ligase [Candidatus Krumholzibacteria bacterium]HRY40435.1 type I glutamate--ammonia ligase [Candidatus Krumholzibacteria bacterium]
MVPEKFAQVRQEAAAKGIEFVDLKSVDLGGRLHHLSLPFDRFTQDICSEGIGFDGSSYGFLKVENSDMVLLPDLATAVPDPFRERPTLHMFASAHLTDPQRTPFAQDGRHIARKAERALAQAGVADCSQWGPEYEFYIFEEADYASNKADSFFSVESNERFHQNAYHACNPFDLYDDFRDEVCRLMKAFGIPVRYHHHEVGKHGQQEIEGWFADILTTGDNAVLTKYILHNAARRAGLRVTFMPKPLYENAGNGFHLHQFLTKNGRNVFDDPKGYASLSQTALYYIGGILAHTDALCAITNPSTNSYKRLVPGFEAPTVRTFGRSNRGAAIRIPSYVSDPDLRRVEYRPPDFTCNPYLCTAAILMAGLDGIVHQIDPVAHGWQPADAPSQESRKDVEFLPRSLDDALDALAGDHQFLLYGDVFPEALIRRWLEVKRDEIGKINQRPHPYEFTMYFDL